MNTRISSIDELLKQCIHSGHCDLILLVLKSNDAIASEMLSHGFYTVDFK